MPIFKHKKYTHFLIAGLAAVGLLFAGLSIGIGSAPNDSSKASRMVEVILARRLSVLESYARPFFDAPVNESDIIRDLPDDMVIYCYSGDSLKLWNHQFPIMNDDIARTVYLQRIVNPKNEMSSPLAVLAENYSFVNLGPSWYVARRQDNDYGAVIMGIEISNSLKEENMNGISHYLNLADRFSIRPLSYTGGAPVNYRGIPLFKVTCESMTQNTIFDAFGVWAAYLLIICAILLFLLDKPVFRRFMICAPVILLSTAFMMWWGSSGVMSVKLFSPALYADGNVFSSLGSVLLLDFAVILLSAGFYIVRGDLFKIIGESSDPKFWSVLTGVVSIMWTAGLAALVWVEVKSISLNSSISFEIYEFSEISIYTAIVYLSLISMMVMAAPLLNVGFRSFGMERRPRAHTSATAQIVLGSILMAFYLVSLSGAFGQQREQAKVSIWANRLSIDRDIAFELSLIRTENAIAQDSWIAALTMVQNSDAVIANRVAESYLARESQDYDISAYVINSLANSIGVSRTLLEKIDDGLPISDQSRYLYYTKEGMRASYYALFTFNVGGHVNSVLLAMDPKANKKDKGYASMIKSASPGKVTLPRKYSFAKYVDKELMSVDGNYTYPTVIKDMLEHHIYETDAKYVRYDGFFHYLNRVTEDEVIIISRSTSGVMKYCFNAAFLSLIIFLTLAVCTRYYGKRNRNKAGKTYYKSRVMTILVASLVVTLVVMAVTSVVFVNRNNNNNLHAMMTEKLDAVQSLLYARFADIASADDLIAGSVDQDIRMVGEATSTDISLFSNDGQIFATTAPYVFEKMYLGSRIDENALYNIKSLSKRYYISTDRYGRNRYHTLYAPAYNKDGDVLAIMSVPYVSVNYDMEEEAVQHLLIIFTLFLILLLMARFFTTAVVENIFKPLYAMGLKMNSADIGSMEYIKYDNDDEITAIVGSYNRMVKELLDSSQKLAQAERDKAWSAMARQVAHEIKNPLTPMKLQIQRIIRLKQKNDPSWQEKFNEASEILLDHIDMLSETANEFSTFAKLYSEPDSVIDVDHMLQEEVTMFDNQETTVIEYIGLEKALVEGPKPQLSRVFINLLGNAVQAVADREGGKVRVSLRHSSADDSYDILFEDNGPGVSEENLDKLFTPNFTTKTGGTGLGLSISKSVLDKCEATISYSRSFMLGGACFTITYPKKRRESISAECKSEEGSL